MNVEVFDLLDCLEKVSKGAFSVFNNLKFNRSEITNITHYLSDEEMTKTERESLSRKLRELKDAGLIRSVKKSIQGEGDITYTFKDPRTTYIINPELLRCAKHDEAELIWDQCGKKRKKQ